MSVFRFELVGPNSWLKVSLEFFVMKNLRRKGNWLIFQYFPLKKLLGGDSFFGFILWLVVKLNKLIVFF